VVWLLVTARVHLLSPDLRRPGRAGDLIIPALDPEGEDRSDWLLWVTRPVCPEGLPEAVRTELDAATAGWSAAQFAALRNELKARSRIAGGGPLPADTLMDVVRDQLPPAIGETRRYQTLQALVNCTRRSLLPNPKVTDQERHQWAEELRVLESRGVR